MEKTKREIKIPRIWEGAKELSRDEVLCMYSFPYPYIFLTKEVTKVDLTGLENVIVQKSGGTEVDILTDTKHHIVARPNLATGYIQYCLEKD